MRTLSFLQRLGVALFATLLSASCGEAQQAVVVPATMFSAPITVSTAATVRIVTGISGRFIYVTNWNIISAGATGVQWVTGTGTNCATNQTPLSGNYTLTAQVGAVVGVGYGTVLVVPQGQDLCIINSAAVSIPGSISYAIF